MPIRIDGRNSTKLTNKETREVVKFFLDMYFTKNQQSKITIYLRFIDTKIESYCSCLDLDLGKPRRFRLSISKNRTKAKQIEHIFHELTHVKQYYVGDMRVFHGHDMVRWKGKLYPPDEGLDYWRSPWEFDAYGTSTCLYELWVEINKRKKKEKPNETV